MARTVKDYSQITVGDIWGDFVGNASYEAGRFCGGVADGFNRNVVEPCRQGIEAAGKWCKDTGEAIKDGAIAVKDGVEDAINFGGAVLNGINTVAKDGVDAAWKAFSGVGRCVADSFGKGFSEARKVPQRDGLTVPASNGAGYSGPEVSGP